MFSWCLAIPPSMSFSKLPIPCPRTPSLPCPVQQAQRWTWSDGLTSSLFLASPQAAPPPPPLLPASSLPTDARLLLPHLSPQAGSKTLLGPCVSFCPCAPQAARRGPTHTPLPRLPEGSKERIKGQAPAQPQSSTPTISCPGARAGQHRGLGVRPLQPPRIKFWRNVCRGRDGC